MNKDIDAAIDELDDVLESNEFAHMNWVQDHKETILKALHQMRDARSVDIGVSMDNLQEAINHMRKHETPENRMQKWGWYLNYVLKAAEYVMQSGQALNPSEEE